MPELQWDELDLLECLEVVPETEDYGVRYSYHVVRSPHSLLLTIRPLESTAQFSVLYGASDTPLIEFTLFIRGGIRHVNDQRGKYLEFQDCVVAPDGFWRMEAGDVFDKDLFAAGVTVELKVKPEVRLWLR